MSSGRFRLEAALAIAACPIFAFLFFSTSGRDDNYLTYWSAHALVQYGELVDYSGERLEPSSSLLHVLLLAPLEPLLPLGLVTLGYLSSLAGAVLAAAGAWWLVGLLGGSLALRSGATLLVATHPFLVYWALGGLETTLVAALLVLLAGGGAAWLAGRGGAALPLVAGCLYLAARPEGPFVSITALLLAAGLIGWRARRLRAAGGDTHGLDGARRRALLLALGLALVALALTSWRLLHFGVPFPQPVLAKMGGDGLAKWRDGVEYLVSSLFSLGQIGFVLLAGFAGWTLLRWPRRSGASAAGEVGLLCVVSLAAAQLGFAVAAGGDWMEAGRFLVPAVPLVVASGLRAAEIRFRSVPRPALLLLVALQLVGIGSVAAFESTGYPVTSHARIREVAGDARFGYFERHNRVHRRDMPVIGRMDRILARLAPATEGRIVVLSGQAGMVPYYLALRHFGAFEFVDARGLGSRHLSSCPAAASSPRDQLGYVLDYRRYFEVLRPACPELPVPDVVFDLLIHPETQPVLEREGYELVYVQRGVVGSQSAWLPGGLVTAHQFVAVRRELARGLRGQRS